ncbi:MAG TPA: DinB family protein [Bryobacteraceae bacterium]|nr:DinB family protein [Bryobacteraceae bacterium]
MKTCLRIVSLTIAGWALAQAQPFPKAPAEQIKADFTDIHRKLLEMAKDFPAGKYGYRLKPEMRSFGEVLVHVTSGIVYAAKAGRGEQVKWSELDPKDYPTKAAIVALMEKSIADANATLTKIQAATFAKTVEPWVAVLEHSAEHYGLLVAYYRANGLVPPESRPRGGK